MLEYEWGNTPSAIMLLGEEPNGESDPNRQMFNHYTTQQAFNQTLLSHQNSAIFSHQTHFHNPNQAEAQPQPNAHLHFLYHQRAYSGVPSFSTPHPSLLSLNPLFGAERSGGGYFLVPKLESSPRDISSITTSSPRCQAEGCNANLTLAKHYHHRHKVCEFHSKASAIIAVGLTQRFCQQCSRFHLLSEFDDRKRSCRKRLADHNRRRRKSQLQPNNQEHQKPLLLENCGCSSSDNPPRSPSDSRVHSSSSSSSSVTMVVLPPRISFDHFRQRAYNPTASITQYFPSG